MIRLFNYARRARYTVPIIICFVVFTIATTAAVMTHDQQSSATYIRSTPANTEVSNRSVLSETPAVVEPTTPTAADTPAQQPQAKPVKKTVAHAPAAVPTLSPAVVSPTIPALSLSFSADGCLVSATGAPGFTFIAGASNSRKGGEVAYTLPASGSLTKSSGAIVGFTAYGSIADRAGNQVAAAQALAPVSGTNCPVPSVP